MNFDSIAPFNLYLYQGNRYQLKVCQDINFPALSKHLWVTTGDDGEDPLTKVKEELEI